MRFGFGKIGVICDASNGPRLAVAQETELDSDNLLPSASLGSDNAPFRYGLATFEKLY